jgi:hypothetical protein
LPTATVAPVKAAKSGKSAEPSAVERLLASGKTNKIDPGTGRSQELHAKCPTDGSAARVRRVTREGNGAIMQVTLRCPSCAVDFVAPTASLYLN